VFLRVYLLGHGGASHDSFPMSTSSPLHGWPPYCGCGLLHALERVFVFNPFPQEAEQFVPQLSNEVRVAHLFGFVCCVFCIVCLRHVSCLADVASFSGLFILDCPFSSGATSGVETVHSTRHLVSAVALSVVRVVKSFVFCVVFC
jgi:hypothetical protein